MYQNLYFMVLLLEEKVPKADEVNGAECLVLSTHCTG